MKPNPRWALGLLVLSCFLCPLVVTVVDAGPQQIGPETVVNTRLPVGQHQVGTPGIIVRQATITVAELPQLERFATPSEVQKAVPRMPLPDGLPMPADFVVPTTSKDVARETDLRPQVASPLPSTSFLALDDNNTAIPPDTHGAVGPNHLMVALNTQVRILNRSGAEIVKFTLDSFWANVGSPDAFDPRVLHDPFSNRWIFTAAADGKLASSSLLIAASQTSDPTGVWNLYRLDVDPANLAWADYPSVGFNKDWVVVQLNMLDIQPEAFSRSEIYVFNKANLYAGASASHTRFSGSNIGGTQVPAVTHDNSLPELYLLQTWNGNTSGNGFLRLFKIAGPVGSETLSTVSFPSTSSPWSSSAASGIDFAPQFGTTIKIDAGDHRMQSVVYRNGSLWAVHNIYLPAGSSPARSAVQWWQLDTSGTVLQRGRIDDSSGSTFYAYPSIAVNRNSDMLIGYSRFSAGQFASANYSFRSAADPPNVLRDDTVLKAGEAPYFRIDGKGRNRWGDYSSTVVDPINDIDMWTIQEYAAPPSGGVDRWGTWWGRVIPPSGPVMGFPDLVSQFSSYSPSTIRAGDLFTINARVQNNGNAAAGQSRLDFYVDADPTNAANTLYYKIGETSVEPLQPGAFADKLLSIPFPSSIPTGSYKTAYWVDAGQQVAESDERNYFYSLSPLTVSPACIYSISPQGDVVGFNGGVGNITVTAATGCTWNASSTASWITITNGSSGTGNGTVSYSVAANFSTSGRSATVMIAGRTYSITQAGAASCTYVSSPASRSHGAGAESSTVAVTTASGCSWTALSNASWITITSGSSGTGNGTVGYAVAANSTSSQRTGSATIAGQIFSVTQAAGTCTYLSSPASRSHGVGAESSTVAVTTASGCSWTASSNASWITITSGSSGTGNGTVGYAVAANFSTSVRTGTVTIAGQLFTVTQSASAPSTPIFLCAPQIAAGIDGAALGEWVTIIELTSLSANPTEVSWSYFSSAGTPLTLSHSTNGQPTGDRSTSLVLLSGRSSVYYELKSSQTVRAGWARFEVPTDSSGNALVGVAVIYHFRGFDGRVRASVGVPVSKALTSATLQIRIAQGVGMALAIANPDQGSGAVLARIANVELRMYDNVGIPGFSAPLLESIVLPVKPGEQLARYVHDLFKIRPTDPKRPLSLEIYSDVPIVITAIRFDADLPSSVPLLPGRPR